MTKNVKDWFSYSTAAVMILSGAVLAFFSFFILHTVVDSILVYLSEALTFAGGVFGCSIYFSSKFGEYESKTNKKINQALEKIEKEENI